MGKTMGECSLNIGDSIQMNQYEFEQKIVQRYANKRMPLKGIFELTGRCNLNCKMCYVHTKSNAEFLKEELDGDWWISQIDMACSNGMMFATLTGGECMLHPEFKRIYSHLRKLGVFTRINTNGLLLTDHMVRFLKEDPPFEIQLTLYGASDDAYEMVTGFRMFHVVERAIERVREAGLNIRIAVTPNAFAPAETEKILEYLNKAQLPYIVNQSLFTPYENDEAQSISNAELSIDERIQYLRKIKKEPCVKRPVSELPPIGGNIQKPIKGIMCGAGRNTFMITHNGCMQPCLNMYHLRVPVCTAEDFSSAWNKIVSAADGFMMPVECEGCAYKSVCLSCPVARSGKVGNGHCDPDVCEMTRALVAAGVKTLK